MSKFFSQVALANASGVVKNGEEVLANKRCAIYFAADWCPDCRNFQPTLNSFYENVNANEKKLEIVFVGSDKSEGDQAAHLKDKQGPWWMIPFDSSLRNELKRKYSVCASKEAEDVGVSNRLGGLPSLVIVDDEGSVVELNGVDKINESGAQAAKEWI